MLIDWFTVSAQIVNFLVLAWLLRRFLFRPVLAAIDQRQRETDEKIQAAQEARRQAEGERNALTRQREDLQHQRLSLISAAETEARAEAQRILAQAETQLVEKRRQGHQQLETEIAAQRKVLVDLLRGEVIASTRKLVADLASSTMENAVAAVFLNRLKRLPPSPPLNGTGRPELRCAFPLDSGLRQQIDQVVRERFGTSDALTVTVDPTLLLGFDLTVGSRRLEWTVDGYLESFREALATKSADTTK